MAPSNPLLQSIVDSTDDAVVAFDRDGLITTWNPAASALYGYGADEVLGKPATLLTGAAALDVSIERTLRGDHVADVDVSRQRKDRTTVVVGETLSPVRDAEGTIVGGVMIARDISGRIELEQALAATQRELEAQNRQLARSNAELEEFAYVASHDPSEPLRAVAGMVGLLERRYKGQLDQDADEFIAYAVEGCARMRTLIEDLLSFSRAGRVELRRREFDAGSLVQEVVGALGPQIAEADAEVRIGRLPTITADFTELGRVFQNLISNAIKFRREDLRPTVEVSATRDGRTWRFSVTDNGIGIEEQYRAKIFRMFQRLHTREAYPGTGIGLAIAERVVDRHGGTMGVAGNATGGTTFWFTVPDDPEGTGR